MHWFRGFLIGGLLLSTTSYLQAELQVGAAVEDISPEQYPVLVNGSMTSNSADQTTYPINARAIVVSDGEEKIAIVVVDSCMMPRDLLDDAKAVASRRTGIPVDHILISATHAHSVPSSMGCLGTNVDPVYAPFLRDRLSTAIEKANAKLEPAQVGWGLTDAADFTAVRRWIYRSDRVQLDPFGNPTVRANMHAGGNWDNVTGPSAAEDPALSVIAFQSPEGKPLAVLTNFSMHYFGGVKALHPDYYGLFCDRFTERLAAQSPEAAGCVVAMSHGCSGDIWRRDYLLPPDQRNDKQTVDEFTNGLLDLALKAYDKIEFTSAENIDMQESRMELKYRVPDKQLLEWSQKVAATVGDRLPKTREEIYALEQIILHERQSTEIVVQAIRIGDIAIATTPNETYAITGFKVKLQSPLEKTMVIELANGGDGYIPPPEQHLLGGYNTWPARSAGLEVQAEPKIVSELLALLEQVTSKPRRIYQQPQGQLTAALLQLQPVAYYRMDEFSGTRAVDATGNGRDGVYEPGVAYFLEGPDSAAFAPGDVNRAMHFTGGRLDTRLSDIGDKYTISLWLWNGMPASGREVCGWLFSRGRNYDAPTAGEQLGIQGTAGEPGTLIFTAGNQDPLVGKTVLDRWTWQHLVLVRDGESVQVYLNGNPQPELTGKLSPASSTKIEQFFFAGRSDASSGFEGRLDEVAIFDRVLTEKERARLSTKVD